MGYLLFILLAVVALAVLISMLAKRSDRRGLERPTEREGTSYQKPQDEGVVQASDAKGEVPDDGPRPDGG